MIQNKCASAGSELFRNDYDLDTDRLHIIVATEEYLGTERKETHCPRIKKQRKEKEEEEENMRSQQL